MYSTVIDGANLRTAYDVNCYRVARFRVDWQFQRSSWSGYRKYTDWLPGGWGPAGSINAQTIRAYCGSGGTYNYRGNIKVVVEATTGTHTSPQMGTGAGRYSCGTGAS